MMQPKPRMCPPFAYANQEEVHMDRIAGEWHEVNVRVDMVMTADGERPGYVFEDMRCLGCENPGYCVFLEGYWPPEFNEVPGPGRYLVRYTSTEVLDDLEWQER